jgi:uncharacterized low-complexity protein
MSNTRKFGFALGTAVAASLIALPAAQAFQMQDLGSGYQLVHDHGTDKKDKEGKCGEGKCGAGKEEGKDKEGKCGEGKCGAGKEEGKEKGKEGKCGEGKCGGAA